MLGQVGAAAAWAMRVGAAAGAAGRTAVDFDVPKWVPEAAGRKTILIDNPVRFYGFAAAAG
jgi:hypothetical protein